MENQFVAIIIGVLVLMLLGLLGLLAVVWNMLKLEREKKNVAEEKNLRIPTLESVINEKDSRISAMQNEATDLKIKLSVFETKLEEEKKAAQEKLEELNRAREKLAETFKALASDALKNNTESFLRLANTNLEKFQDGAKNDLEKRQKSISELVQPLKNSLEEIEKAEKERNAAYTSLTEQIKSVNIAHVTLQNETSKLVNALRSSPGISGQWGQIQLRRVVEIAGMVSYCDFIEQAQSNANAIRIRPDMVVKLPNQRNIIVDSKAPTQVYFAALEVQDDVAKSKKLKDYAKQVRAHIGNLGAKSYWEQFQPTPEFVVLFLPGEMLFSAALQQDPDLIEYGTERNVIIATPTTLISLLKAVAYGWRQEQITQNAQKISNLGKELYERIYTFIDHFSDIHKNLDNCVEAYNKAVGSLESRVLVTARRFKELGAAAGSDIKILESIDKATRPVQTSDLNNENPT